MPCPHRLVRQPFRFDVVGADAGEARHWAVANHPCGVDRFSGCGFGAPEALGSALIDPGLAVRESEIELFAEASAEEVVRALRRTH